MRIGHVALAAGADRQNDVLALLEQVAEAFVLFLRDRAVLVGVDLRETLLDRAVGKLAGFDLAVAVLLRFAMTFSNASTSICALSSPPADQPATYSIPSFAHGGSHADSPGYPAHGPDLLAARQIIPHHVQGAGDDQMLLPFHVADDRRAVAAQKLRSIDGRQIDLPVRLSNASRNEP